MEARLHYSRPLMLHLQGPAASPSSPALTAPGAVPNASPVPVPVRDGELNSDAILTLALLTCGIVAALAVRVVLQCVLRVTRRACYGGTAAADDPEDQEQQQQQHAARHGRKQPRRHPALVQALPCVAFSAGLEQELAGSSRAECAICLAEFARGEAVRVLPRCNHGFHARCIDRWLAASPTCPTCRQAPFDEPTALLQPDSSGPAVVPLVRVVIVGDRVARLVEP